MADRGREATTEEGGGDIVRRMLDAGAAFTQMTQERAETFVRDLVKRGEIRKEQRQEAIQDLVDRSRQNYEDWLDRIRRDIRGQVASLGLATKEDVEALRSEITSLRHERSAAATTPAATTATKAPAKKAPAKSTAKSTATKATTAKKAAAKKSSST